MQKQKLQHKTRIESVTSTDTVSQSVTNSFEIITFKNSGRVRRKPYLEESENSEDINIDELEEENNNSYKYRYSTNSEYSEFQISNTDESLSSHLKKQLIHLIYQKMKFFN